MKCHCFLMRLAIIVLFCTFSITNISYSAPWSAPQQVESQTLAPLQQTSITPTAIQAADNQNELSVILKDIVRSGKPIVNDLSLEAFIPELEGEAQQSQGRGGLGFLNGETYGSYALLKQYSILSVLPLYETTREGKKIDWDKETGIHKVMVPNKSGALEQLEFPVAFNGNKAGYRVKVYWVNCNGTPVFLLRSPEFFRCLYPGQDEQSRQYGFFARSYVELMKKIDLKPAIVRLSEPQMLFVAVAMENDRTFYRLQQEEMKKNKSMRLVTRLFDRRILDETVVDAVIENEKSIFADTRILMTTHTPEKAAMISYVGDRAYKLRDLVGADLVDPVTQYTSANVPVVDAARELAKRSMIINAVSREHGDVTKYLLPGFRDKTMYIQNGSEPTLWQPAELKQLVNEVGVDGVSGQELFDITSTQKERLNAYLQENAQTSFSDLNRPTFGLVRRLVEYKAQGMFLPLIQWITGDRDKEYEVDICGEKRMLKGLGANLLIGGEANDTAGHYWSAEFRKLVAQDEFRGKFIFLGNTGIEFMQLAASACDFWSHEPTPTREASGTSFQRAAFCGNLNIATATGGPVDYISVDNETGRRNGWLIDVFKAWHLDDVIRNFEEGNGWTKNYFYKQVMEETIRSFSEASAMYYDYTEQGGATLLKNKKYTLETAYATQTASFMVTKYGLAFDSILDNTGVAGYEHKLHALTNPAESNEVLLNKAA